jgi:DNA polymerase III delta subunit
MIIILASFETQEDAEMMANILVDKKLAACVSLIPVHSLYFWKGEKMVANEFEAVIKTKAEKFDMIEQEIKKRGALIEPSAMDFLVSFTGEEMWHLNSLIDQLVAYAHARTIVLSDVSLFITEKMDDNIFNLVDALVSGDHKKAFNLLAYQRQIGAEDGQIIGLIVWQLRILIQLRDLLDREENSTSDSAAKKIGIHPFVAKKNWSLVKRYSLQKLQTLYRLLLDMDIKTKTGVASQELLLDMFAAKV